MLTWGHTKRDVFQHKSVWFTGMSVCDILNITLVDLPWVSERDMRELNAGRKPRRIFGVGRGGETNAWFLVEQLVHAFNGIEDSYIYT